MKKPDKLFLADGRYVRESELQYLNHGDNADVWRWNSSDGVFAIKTFYPDCHMFALDQRIADIFVNLNFQNLSNLYSIVRSNRFDKKSFDGYVMDYFDEDQFASLLDISSSNLYDSISDLEKDISLLSSHAIVLDDVKAANAMITTDGMFHLLDYDLFSIDSSHSLERIAAQNGNEVRWLVHSSFIIDLIVDLEFTEDEKNRIRFFLDDEFSRHKCYNLNLSDVVGTLFCNDSTPRDALKQMIR